MQESIIILLLSLISSFSYGGKVVDGSWHEVKARKGDGIELLLKRYELHREAALHDHFRSINNLSKNSYLYAGKKYKLPVKLYNYNGQSIRSTIGLNDWDNAVRIKKYNETLLAKGIRKTHFRDSKILWVPITRLEANTAPTKMKPAVASNDAGHTLPIYGKGNDVKKLTGQTLKGKVFYVIAGHGGPDPGAMCTDCKTTLCEDEYAYDVSLRLARNLEEQGAKVEMVIQDKNDGIRDAQTFRCDKDEVLADGSKIPLNHMKRLQQRTNYVNKKYKFYRDRGYQDQMVISLHVDSNSKSVRQDVFFCYAKGSKESQKIAADLSQTFQRKYDKHQRNRGYKGHLHERGLWVLRKTAPPAVLIELANIKNRNDHRRILLESNRQALANWIYDGILDHYHLTESTQQLASN